MSGASWPAFIASSSIAGYVYSFTDEWLKCSSTAKISGT